MQLIIIIIDKIIMNKRSGICCKKSDFFFDIRILNLMPKTNP